MSLSEEQLRERLFEAVASGAGSAFEELCQRYREEIVAAYPRWQNVPEELRRNPAEVQRYGQALMGLAAYFAQELGDARLYHLLEPPARRRARELGALGEACFMEGQTGPARDATLEALELSREAGDTEGVAAYLGNLYEIDRYRGDGAGAARWASEFADLCAALGQPEDARRWRRLAQTVRNEPLVRLVAEVGGEEYELDELPPHLPDGTVRFHFRRNRLTLRPAQRLVAQGVTLAEEGRYADALDRFQQAGAADRYDPDSRCLAGLTLLHLGRYAEAVEVYAEAQRLGPGWFQVTTDAWLAEELAAGRLEPATWKFLLEVEDGEPAPEGVLEGIERVLRQHPRLAPAHLARAQACERLGDREAALAAYRQAAEHAAEANLKTRALLGLALLEQEPERTRLLREVGALDGHLLSGATARWLLLSGGVTG